MDYLDDWNEHNALASYTATMERAIERPARPRRTRKPSLATLIKQAERTGRNVTSIVHDGVTLTFGEAVKTNNNSDELDRWMAKHAH